MEEVVRAVAKEEGYTEDDVQQYLAILHRKRVRTVHNLRALSQERIEGLGLPRRHRVPALRVKAGGEQ